MNERTRFVGLDAHAATIAVAVADAGMVEERGTITNEPGQVARMVGWASRPGSACGGWRRTCSWW